MVIGSPPEQQWPGGICCGLANRSGALPMGMLDGRWDRIGALTGEGQAKRQNWLKLAARAGVRGLWLLLASCAKNICD